MAVRGWVQACEWRPRGSELTADAAAAATVLHIEDPTDFDDAGGIISINDELYIYNAEGLDADAGTLTLDVGLTEAATTGDGVHTVSGGQVQRDVVLFVACGDGDLVEVEAGFAQRDYWPEGDYEDPVQVLLSDDLETLIDAPSRLPRSVELEETRTDIDTTLGELNEDLTELNEVTLPQVQADLAEAVSDITGLSGMFPISGTNISDGAITTPKLATNAVTADKITASSITGAKIVGLTITGDKLAANSISADKIVANSIGADRLAANAVTADKLAANAIDGKTITGVTIHSGVLVAPAISAGSDVTIDIYDSVNILGATEQLYVQGGISTGTGNVSAGGSISGFNFNVLGRITATGSLSSWVEAGGEALYLKESGRFAVHATPSRAAWKRDLTPIDVDPNQLAKLQPLTYRYREDVPFEANPDEVFYGYTYDQAEALGLDDLIVTGRMSGLPEARLDRLPLLLLKAWQKDRARQEREREEDRRMIADLTARIEALESAQQ